jgi:iron complex outermembrane receptor protein
VGARNSSFTRVASGQVNGSVQDSSTSWEAGVSKTLSQTYEVFFKTGSSYRLPNADEFMCYAGFCPAQVINSLRPQTSRDVELGFKFKRAETNLNVRIYRHLMRDEIGLTSDYSTTNLDPSLRQGVEFEIKHLMNQKFQLNATAAQRRNEFVEGPFAGKKIPLASDQNFTGRVTYRMDEQQNLSIAANWVAEQRISGDNNNSCAEQIPSYSTWDARYMRDSNNWTFSATVLNLADRSYYSVRTRCNANLKSIYPEAGRTYVLSAKYKF